MGAMLEVHLTDAELERMSLPQLKQAPLLRPCAALDSDGDQ